MVSTDTVRWRRRQSVFGGLRGACECDQEISLGCRAGSKCPVLRRGYVLTCKEDSSADRGYDARYVFRARQPQERNREIHIAGS